MERLLVAHCIVCGMERPIGLRIGPAWCCAACEERIVGARVESDEYEELLLGMHRLWYAISLAGL